MKHTIISLLLMVSISGQPPDRVGCVACGSCVQRVLSQDDAFRFAIEAPLPTLPKFGRIEGCVSVLVEVGTSGQVVRVSGLLGHPLLVQRAEAALQNWRFRISDQKQGFQAPLSFWFSSVDGVSRGCTASQP